MRANSQQVYDQDAQAYDASKYLVILNKMNLKELHALGGKHWLKWTSGCHVLSIYLSMQKQMAIVEMRYP